MASAAMGPKRGGGQTLVGLVVAVGLLASGAAMATVPDYAYLSQFGSSGGGNGQFGPRVSILSLSIPARTTSWSKTAAITA